MPVSNVKFSSHGGTNSLAGDPNWEIIAVKSFSEIIHFPTDSISFFLSLQEQEEAITDEAVAQELIKNNEKLPNGVERTWQSLW